MKNIIEGAIVCLIGVAVIALLVFANELEKASKVSGCRSGLETLIEGSCE